ncbi:hypothetical protein AXK60_16935 [Tsukamurella pseudospumae]|nr:hypothetical protein AXK60_16935 [Tsukamurella pseudospumae]
MSDGTAITGLESQNHGGTGPFPPQYQPRFVVLGAHVSTDTDYQRMRFAIDAQYLLPQVWAHTEREASVSRPDVAGTIRPLYAEDQWWLEYEAADPRPLRAMIDSIAHATTVLIKLAFNWAVTLTDVRLQLPDDEEWLQVVSARSWESSRDGLPGDTPMALESLTLGRLGTFIDLHDRLDALSDPVANDVNGPIQATMLTNASVAEGIHRRLWDHRKRFELTEGVSLRPVRRAAIAAGTAKFVELSITDEKTAGQALQDGLQFLNEISFKHRVQDLAAEAASICPEIFEAVPDFPDKLTKARNELAHQLLDPDDQPETLSTKVDRWIVLERVTRWMLKIVLLHRTGISKLEIAHALNAHAGAPNGSGYPEYLMTRANNRAIATELGWFGAIEGGSDATTPVS